MTAIELMERLKSARIHFTMTTVRDYALMFEIAVPGERWELEIFDDGHVELERYRSTAGRNLGIEPAQLEALISEYSDEK